MGIRAGSIRNSFGAKARTNKDGTPRPHQGWDLTAPVGTDVMAVSAGDIIDTPNVGDYGMQILLKFTHEETTYYAFYAHLGSIAVKTGDKVTEGQVIGKTGMTGNAKKLKKSEAHLHFEIRTIQVVGKGMKGRTNPSDLFDDPLKK